MGKGTYINKLAMDFLCSKAGHDAPVLEWSVINMDANLKVMNFVREMFYFSARHWLDTMRPATWAKIAGFGISSGMNPDKTTLEEIAPGGFPSHFGGNYAVREVALHALLAEMTDIVKAHRAKINWETVTKKRA